MGSQRKLIRHAAVEILKSQVLSADQRVFKSRSSAIWLQSELPCLCVYTTNESPDIVNDFPKIIDRTLQIHVDIFVEEKLNQDLTSDTDDRLDDLADEIETILEKNQRLNGTIQSLNLSDTKITLLEEGARPVGICRLTYTAEYRTTNEGGY